MSNDSSPSPFDDEPSIEAVSQSATPAKPRISILHLLVWTATSAAMLAVMRWRGGINSELTPLDAAYRIGFGIYGGTVVGGVLIWIARRWRRQRFPTEPGEWLLIVQGCAVIAVGTCSFIDQVWEQGDWLTAGTCVVLLAIGALPIILYRHEWIWRWFFVVLELLYATPLNLLYSVGFLDDLRRFFWSAFSLLIILVLSLCIAVGTDVRRGIRRGWVHWLGVVTAFVFAIVHLGLFTAEVIRTL